MDQPTPPVDGVQPNINFNAAIPASQPVPIDLSMTAQLQELLSMGFKEPGLMALLASSLPTGQSLGSILTPPLTAPLELIQAGVLGANQGVLAPLVNPGVVVKTEDPGITAKPFDLGIVAQTPDCRLLESPTDLGAQSKPADSGEFDRPDNPIVDVKPIKSELLPPLALLEASAKLGIPGGLFKPLDFGSYANTANLGVLCQSGSLGTFAKPADPAIFANTYNLGILGQPSNPGIFAKPADPGVFGKPSDFGLYANAANLGVLGQSGGFGTIAKPADPAIFANPYNLGILGQPSNPGIFAKPADPGVFGKHLDFGIYSKPANLGIGQLSTTSSKKNPGGETAFSPYVRPMPPPLLTPAPPQQLVEPSRQFNPMGPFNSPFWEGPLAMVSSPLRIPQAGALLALWPAFPPCPPHPPPNEPGKPLYKTLATMTMIMLHNWIRVYNSSQKPRDNEIQQRHYQLMDTRLILYKEAVQLGGLVCTKKTYERVQEIYQQDVQIESARRSLLIDNGIPF